MGGLPIPKLRIPQGLPLWGTLSGLLLLGMATTVIDLTGMPAKEQAHANSNKQRAIIDPATKAVSLGTAKEEPSFDVAEAPKDGPHGEEVTSTEESSAEAKSEEKKSEEHQEEAKTEEPKHEEVKAEEKPAEVKEEAHSDAKPEEAKPEEHQEEAKPAEEAKHEEKPVEPVAEKPAEAQSEAVSAEESSEALPVGLTPLRTTAEKVGTPMVVRTHESLVTSPAPEITEIIDQKPYPKVGEKDAKAATLYARRFTHKEGEHLLTFLVMDVGLDAQSVPLMLNLPREVTAAISPYARKPRVGIEVLRSAGIEVWSMLPTMSDHYPQDDPGPLGLIGSMPSEELIRRLHEIMTSLIGSVGFVLPPDENISSRKGAFSDVLFEIEKRGMLLASTHPTHSLESLTSEKKLQKIIRRTDLILDPVPNEAQITSKLAGLIEAASMKQHYIVVMSARPQTLRLVGEWLKKTKLPEPLALAPLSAQYLATEEPAEEKKEESGGHGEAKEEKHDEKKSEPKKEEKKSSGHH